ncbi:putative Epsin-2 [Hypsibius exemplaris]|uniref:Epsin-2 n=1 Tax=Hypsibius exemplaris TaxID=2072580 RepID=A0A1W0WA41_HYPEX|nr:putative Epsin-2 [Hypsibius exemplaris]
MENIQKACRNMKYLFDPTIIDPVQIKVREVTSSDPWGPTASDMSELANLSYTKSPVIVPDLFLRLDDGNWRVVYKTLVVLDYIIKYGSETVLVDCTRNLARLHELQSCRAIEDGQDHGLNIREKSRQIVALLTDPVRLKLERAKARRIHQRVSYRNSEFRQFFNGASPPLSINERDIHIDDEEDIMCRPNNAEEEAIQLELALAASKNETERSRSRIPSYENRPHVARRLVIPDPTPPATPVAVKATDLIDLSEWSVISLADPTPPARSNIKTESCFSGINEPQLSATNPFAGDVLKAQALDLEILSKWFTPWLELQEPFIPFYICEGGSLELSEKLSNQQFSFSSSGGTRPHQRSK